MGVIDIIILAILVIGAFKGFRRGFLLELIAIFALILGIIGGLKLLHLGIDFLSTNFNIQGVLLPYLSFLLIFVIIIILVNLLGRVIKKAIDLTLLGNVDDIMGALVGILKWSLGLSVLLWISSSFGIEIPERITHNSFIYPWIEDLAPAAAGYLTSVFPFLEDLVELIHEFIQQEMV